MRVISRFFICLICFHGLFSCCPVPTTEKLRARELAVLPKSKNRVLAKAGLIGIHEVDLDIVLDQKYKKPTRNTRVALYSEDFPALLQPETAVRLKHANLLLKEHGMRVLVWDAYRPPSAQIMLWEQSDHNDDYVINPYEKPSHHSIGVAVDVSLIYENGELVKMPTDFDTFTEAAASDYVHADPEVRKNLKILQSAMKTAGFRTIPGEWWHFLDNHYKNYTEAVDFEKIEHAL